MDVEQLLIAALRRTGRDATVERDPETGLTRVDGHFDLERVAEAFATALHRRDERTITGRDEPTVDQIEAEMRALLAPVK